ncbi:MAG TPA: class I adenylate-forming enzyme family protein [Pseudolabrys sp.]|nr:class I adenylate-forming enzyme family protein [Pseudolabrys sp.]
MILGDSDYSGTSRATLDDLFRRAGVRHADRLALVDPPNRAAFIGGAPRALTFAQADRAISALAARLCGLGLYSDTVVAIQLANTVESVIALLGVLRAGMIAAPIPLLWRQKDMIEALGRVGARAIITAPRIGACTHTEIAMQVAAELFPIRYVCAFGDEVGDGVMPLDDIFDAPQTDLPPQARRPGNPAAHVAIVSFDRDNDGPVAVARNHLELIAGGSSVFLESGLPAGAPILSTIPVTSFAGLSLTLLPWLLNGGTLHLHHGFDAAAFGAQCEAVRGGMVVVPASALAPIADTAALDAASMIAALWRAPERMMSASPWPGEAALIDVVSFGETGLIAARRGADGMPVPLPLGPVRHPRGAADAMASVETMRSKANTLALRGAMVPVNPFPPGAGMPALAVDEAGFVDTGYACRLGDDPKMLVVSGPPGGFASIGFYRFRQNELEAEIAAFDPAATIVALPDALLGQRLAGSAGDPGALQDDLQRQGVNPLLAHAFRSRKQTAA